MRREVIGPCTLYCGDCREVLPSVKCDAVVVDPPYGIGLRNGDVDGHRSDRWDSIAGDDSPALGLAVLDWARGLDVPIVAFASPWKPWPGRWRNLIVWDKGGAVGGGGDIATCLKRSWELVQVWNPGPYNGGRCESVWHCGMTPDDTADHIAAKPVPLLVDLIDTFAPEGGLVCDPCMGSGSTLVAAIQTGRRGIGVEIDPGHFATACTRVEKALEAQSLYVPAPREVQGELGAAT